MNKTRIIAGTGLIAGLGLAGWLMLNSSTDDGRRASADADASSVPEGGPIVQVQVPSELSPDAQIGQRGFDAFCADCHGENAAGRDGVAPPLVHKIYEPSHHGDAAFLLAAQNGVRSHHWSFGSMPPVEGVTRADVMYITAYVRELQRANGIN